MERDPLKDPHQRAWRQRVGQLGNLQREPSFAVHLDGHERRHDHGRSGATFDLTPSFASTAEFTNDGSVVNNGSVAANATGGGLTWTQSGGSVSGNAVALQNGTTLADSAGTGAFVAKYAAAAITGTIPAGQTVTVQGEHYTYEGNEYESTSLSLNGTTLVNDGTLALVAPGSGSGSGGSVFLTDGTIQNHGTVDAAVQDAAWAIHLRPRWLTRTVGQSASAAARSTRTTGRPPPMMA